MYNFYNRRGPMTIKEFARLAGVAPSTVSKIMNGKDDSISAETRARVLSLAKEYNYSAYTEMFPSTAKTLLLGVIMPSSSIYNLTFQGILHAAQALGYSTLICETDDDGSDEYKRITALCRHRVDGVIWEPASKDSIAMGNEFRKNDIPYLLINCDDETAGSVTIDYQELGYRATQVLVESRHTNIACLLSEGYRKHSFFTGYRQCLFDNHIPFRDDFVFSGLGKGLFGKISDQSISGLVCSHYHTALDLYEMADTLHYQMPYDFSLVSLRNDRREINHYPHISTFTVPQYQFGEYVCTQFLSSVESRLPARYDFKPDIILNSRESVDIPLNLRSKSILVIGSINVDYYLKLNALPRSGKTVRTTHSSIYPGGKGLNQAVGISKLGHRAVLIGNVGNDMDSDLIYSTIREYHIDSMGVKRCNDYSTGKAHIFVQDNGDSLISILLGANSSLNSADITANRRLFEDAEYCLLQTEIPDEAVAEALTLAFRYRIKTILKPSACTHLSDDLLKQIHILIPNEEEMAELCPGIPDLPSQADYFLNRGVHAIIVTRGAAGVYVKTPEIEVWIPAADFVAIDATGACDAFISALASYLLQGHDLISAAKIANYAAGLSVTREGTVPALIDRNSLESYIKRIEPELIKDGL